MLKPNRVFFDTNIYIIGFADEASIEAQILDWAGFRKSKPADIEVILSEILVTQILRVAKRLYGKDWGGSLLFQIWHTLNIRYVTPDKSQIPNLMASNSIPYEDIEIYLSALAGPADCFVSGNHGLIKALATTHQAFENFTPAGFAQRYLKFHKQKTG
jgi:hypothetical protein